MWVKKSLAKRGLQILYPRGFTDLWVKISLAKRGLQIVYLQGFIDLWVKISSKGESVLSFSKVESEAIYFITRIIIQSTLSSSLHWVCMMEQIYIKTVQDLSRIIQPKSALSMLHLVKGTKEIFINSKTEFSIHFDGQIYQSDNFEVVNIHEREDEEEKRIITYFHHDVMDVACIYQVLINKPYLKKWLEITFHKVGILERIVVESSNIPENASCKIAKSSGELDICLFLSLEQLGLFFTLDFPYNDITVYEKYFEVSYPPQQNVNAGEIVKSQVSTIGNYPLLNIKQGDFDLGQAEAFRHYLLFDYAKPHLQAPQLVYSSIVNQYTEVNFNVPDTPKDKSPIQNKIFYTLTNAPYLMIYPEHIPGEVDFCKSLSMDFCQIYEGPFEWTEEKPDEKTLIDISNYAQEKSIKLGLYTGANNLTAPHFNHYGEQKGKPEWHIIDANGKETGTYCFGSDDFTRWFTDTIIHASQNYGFLMTNFDFLTIAPCYARDHNHPPDGIYQQIANVWKCLNEIRLAVPGYVFDSNLGWAPLVPKIACEMDGFYLTDPYVNTYFPSLNATKILDDSRRADMVRYFRDYLTPVEYFRNCEYFVCADSVIHDSALFEYGILQGLAVTPNLQLGESLALFDRLNSKQCEYARKFLAKWTQFVKDNWEYYHYTKILTDLPSVGQVEIYAHCKDDKGYIFLVNPNSSRLSAQFKLDETIGLSSSGGFLIKELYPEENCLPAIGRLPYKQYGDIIQYIVESQSCVVLSIEPASSDNKARIFGLPAFLQRINNGYQVKLSYFQGNHKRLFLQLPSNEKVISIYSDGQEIPFSQENDLYSFNITFPKEKVEPELHQWVICEASLDSGLKQSFHQGIDGDAITFPVLRHFLSDKDALTYKRSLDELSLSLPATFLGAYIENLLNEKYTISLEIQTEKTDMVEDYESKKQSSQFVSDTLYTETTLSEDQKTLIQVGCKEFWLSSNFEAPFVQKYIPPDYHHHNFIMLNFFRPEQIKNIRAWINGTEVVVNRYDYWRGGTGSFTYYIDGTKSSLQGGKNKLVVWISS